MNESSRDKIKNLSINKTTDISKKDRAKGIKYLLQKYGKDNVCQIVTFGKYNLKNTIKAAMSALIPDSYEEANSITKKIPGLLEGETVSYELLMKMYNNPEKYDLSSKTLNEIKVAVETLENLFNEYPEIYDCVSHLSGAVASVGLHAGGVIIASKPLYCNVPIMEGSDTAVLPVVQLEMSDIDYVKLLKIDVLGLNNLSQISDCMKLVGLDYKWYYDEDFSDPKVYEMLRRGETTDIFQMASPNATKMIKDMHADCFADLIATNAGNRPGPLAKNPDTGKSMVDLYEERKASGNVPSLDKRIDWILESTYGCIFYQEQCMQLGQVMAGYTLGNADKRIRKPLAKKVKKMIPEIENEFIYGKDSVKDDNDNVIDISDKPSKYCSGSLNNGFDEELSKNVFKTIKAFASYAFNKSHSGSYAMVGYKTAWLSYYYPVEWAISCMSNYDKQEKITATLNLCKKRNIPILPPSVNNSDEEFTIEIVNNKKAIRYGLLAIKDVGKEPINYIKSLRNDLGDFTSFDDFYSKVHEQNNIALYSNKKNKNGAKQCPINKKCEAALIKAGAFDSFEENRYILLNHYMVDIKKDKDYTILDPKEYTRKIKLNYEKELMGSYVSEHPLEPFPYIDLSTVSDNSKVEIVGLVKKTSIKNTKNGKKYATCFLESKDGTEFRAMLFGAMYENNKDKLKKDNILVINGVYNAQYNNIKCDKIRKIVKKSQVIKLDGSDDAIEDNSIDIPEQKIEMPIVDVFSDIEGNPVDMVLGL